MSIQTLVLYIGINVSSVMEFLAWFYQKNEWASRKLLYFMNWHSVMHFKSAKFDIQSQYLSLNNLNINSCCLEMFFLWISNLCYWHLLLTLDLEVLYFLEFFYKLLAMSVFKINQFSWNPLIFENSRYSYIEGNIWKLVTLQVS